MMRPDTRHCIFVLGMHRSGTSALTGVLHLLGVDLGSDLMPPGKDDNPKGFFENNKIYSINETILERLNSSWDVLFPLPEKWWQEEPLAQSREDIFQVLEEEFASSQLFGVKDPRLCHLLPLWQNVFQEAGIASSYIIIVRNPLETAASLARRDHFSTEKSVLLWMYAMLDAEFYTRNHPRVFVSFDSLLKEPQSTINAIVKALTVDFPKPFQDVEPDIRAFLTPELKHHTTRKKTMDRNLLSLIAQYYAILQRCLNTANIPPQDCAEMERLRQEFYIFARWFYHPDIRRKVSLLKEKEAEIEHLRPRYYTSVLVDTGSGFLEGQPIRQELSGKELQLEFDLSDWREIKQLRFVPANTFVVIQLRQLKLISAHNAVRGDLSYSNNALFHSGKRLIFQTPFPAIDIDVLPLEKPEKLVVALEYLAWGAETYRYLDQERQAENEKLSREMEQFRQALNAANQMIRKFEQKYYAQLLIDTGSDFNKQEALLHILSGEETQLTFDVSMFDGIREFRFDPLQGHRVVLRLTQVKIISVDYTLHTDIPYSTNALYHKDDLFIFNTDEPYIYIAVNDLPAPKTLVLELTYLAWGNEVYKYISREQTAFIQSQEQQIRQYLDSIAAHKQQIETQERLLQDKEREIQQLRQALETNENHLHRQAHSSKMQEQHLQQQALALKNVEEQFREQRQIIRAKETVLQEKARAGGLLALIRRIANQIKPPKPLLVELNQTVLQSDRVEVAGWAIAPEGIAEVNVLIDGHLIDQAEYGQPSPDIAAIYPDISGSDAGRLSLSSDLKGWQYDLNAHTVALVAVSHAGRRTETLQTITMTPRVLVRLEQVRVYCDKLEVTGWAVSEDGIRQIEVFMDDHLIGNATYGYEKEEIAREYPDIQHSRDSGFELAAALGKMVYRSENHAIVIRAISWSGLVAETSQTVMLTPRVIVQCDTIKLYADVLELSGWVVSDALIEHVAVYVDEDFIGNAEHGRCRPDVAKTFQDFPNRDNAGFVLCAHCNNRYASLTEHALGIRIVSQGQILSHTARTVSVLPYNRVYCETAELSHDTLEVAGWAISDIGIARVEIYRNGELLGIASYGFERRDVESTHPWVKDSRYCGFMFSGARDCFPELEGDISSARISIRAINTAGQSFETETIVNEIDTKPEQNYAENSGVRIKFKAFLAGPDRMSFPHWESPLVSIILLQWNKGELTYQCLESLKTCTDVSYEIVLVDNGSRDEALTLLERLENVTIIRNSENLGFLRASNQGVQQARGKYVLFLNNDTQVLPNTLSALVNTIEGDPQIGAVGGKLIFPNGTLQEAGSIIWNDASCRTYGRGDDPFKPEYSYLKEVYYCAAALLLTPRQLFIDLGMFDEFYLPATFEDVDYCMKVRDNGYKVVYQPLAQVIHHEFATTGEAPSIRFQMMNRPKFKKKWAHVLADYYEPHEDNILSAREFTIGKPLKRVLFIDDRIPDPQLGSGYPRSLDMLNVLVELGYQVTFFPLQFPEPCASVSQTLQQKGVEMFYDHTGKKKKLSLQTVLKSRKAYYDMILVSRPHNMKEVLPLKKDIIDKHVRLIYDAEAVFVTREILYREVSGETLSEAEKESLIRQEVELAKHADAVISVSTHEKAIFEAYDVKNIHVVGHKNELHPTAASFDQRSDFLFVGSILFSQSPNEDAVLHFVKHIYPAIYHQTHAKLFIVGTNKSEAVNHLAEEYSNIIVTGRVERLDEYYNKCRVFIIPTRYAAGMPYKFHEAASYGVPAVVTPLIAEQIGWQEGEGLLVGHDDNDFTQKCLELYTNKERWEHIRSGASEMVKQDCHPEVFKNNLYEALESSTH